MSKCARTIQDIRDSFKSCKNRHYYEQWAATYNEDYVVMECNAPKSTADILMKHFTLPPDQARVLDVCCGTGLVAQKLSCSGFRHFIGVDGSQAMLEKARLTGLYQDLLHVQLGTLPFDSGKFDVVVMVGALHRKYVSYEVIRELCRTAKPGGFVVMTQAEYLTPEDRSYTEELRKLQKCMEEEGLWKKLEVKLVEDYLINPHHTDGWASGSTYLYQKTL